MGVRTQFVFAPAQMGLVSFRRFNGFRIEELLTLFCIRFQVHERVGNASRGEDRERGLSTMFDHNSISGTIIRCCWPRFLPAAFSCYEGRTSAARLRSRRRLALLLPNRLPRRGYAAEVDLAQRKYSGFLLPSLLTSTCLSR